ncbi:MAG: hypothetical protein U1F43_35165 [Myxococcota bacterium]
MISRPRRPVPRALAVSARAVLATLATLASKPAAADVPVLPDGALDAACAEAKKDDACPACTCLPLTSTPADGDFGTRALDNPIGLVVEVAGQRPDGSDYRAAHVVMGAAGDLRAAALVAEHLRLERGGWTDYSVEAARRIAYICDDCTTPSVDFTHVFVVTEARYEPDADAGLQHKAETRSLAVCAGGGYGLNCYRYPLGGAESVVTLAHAPGDKERVTSKRRWSRSWKVGRGQTVTLGPVSGKAGDDEVHARGAVTIDLADPQQCVEARRY